MEFHTGTHNSIEFFNPRNQLGEIKAGYLVDLVLLEDSPLNGISNPERIHTGIVDGKVYSCSDLDQIFTKI